MRKFLYILSALLLCSAFPSCSKYDEAMDSLAPDAKIFYARVPSSDDDTKTYLDGDWNMYWYAEDLLSVFRSATNEKYRFAGRGGEIVNEFHKCDASVPAAPFSRNYALYPYSGSTTCASEGVMTTSLPALQHYSPDTFGQDANTMVAVTQDSEDDVFYFQNVCGYIRLKIYGGETIRKIVLRGNNGEKLAGEAVITAAYGTAPSLVMSESATTEITLDCGEDGVETVDDPDQYTSFWFVVPPVTFTKGFSFDITTSNGITMSQATNKSITIGCNQVKQMATFEWGTQFLPKLTFFSISDGIHTYKAFDISDGYVNIMVPNQSDLSEMTAAFTYRGVSVKVGDIEQTSGQDSHNFNDLTDPVEYVVTSADGTSQTYKIRIFDLPVVIINTDDGMPVTSKVNYKGCSIKILDCDKETILDEEANIKGRGNATWGDPKKPYNIKFSSKVEVLGMPKHKKWCMLNNYRDRTMMRNDVCQEIGRLSDNLGWCPHGQHIDLIFNGEHKGVYWLCEKIEADENRVNVDKERGFLFEYDRVNDGDYKFKSPFLCQTSGYVEYIKLKAPVESPEEDPDSVILKDLRKYITEFEDVLSGQTDGDYRTYIDLPSFVDYMFVEDISGNGDAGLNSTYAHKDIDGKMRMGPLWDFDYGVFASTGSFLGRARFYYPLLLEDEYFKQMLKKCWSVYKLNLFSSYIPDYVESLYLKISRSAERDRIIWPDSGGTNGDANLSIQKAKDRLITIYKEKVSKEDAWVSSVVINYGNNPSINNDFDNQNDSSSDFGFGF